MQAGDAAAWASAVGAVGALGFTAYMVRRQIDRECRADDYQRRMYAKRVSVVAENPLKHAEVINDSPDTIYDVGVYIRARSSDALIARSGGLRNFMLPGEKKHFNFVHANGSSSPLPDSVCFVQFADSNGYRWNRYMMGRAWKKSIGYLTRTEIKAEPTQGFLTATSIDLQWSWASREANERGWHS